MAGPNPGGSHQDPAAKDIEAELNSPNVPTSEKVALTYPDNEAGRQAQKEVLERMKAAVKAGEVPDDFTTSKETIARLDRARTTLWNENQSNFEDLKNVKIPVLVTDGRSDVVDPPKNSLMIANQIPFAWLAFSRVAIPSSSSRASNSPPRSMRSCSKRQVAEFHAGLS